MVINGSETENDAYVLPYKVFKGFFTEDYLDHRNRWNGTIKDNIIKLTLTANNKPNKYLSVGAFYNAFSFLVSNLPDENEIHVVTTDSLEINLSNLQKLIQEFNEHYSSIAPEKRITVSERIARPNAITDYIKKIQKFTCQICKLPGFQQKNGSKYIEAHHIIELHDLIPGSYCSDNIITACPTCHRKLHYASVLYQTQNEQIVSVIINGQAYSFQRNVISEKVK